MLKWIMYCDVSLHVAAGNDRKMFQSACKYTFQCIIDLLSIDISVKEALIDLLIPNLFVPQENCRHSVLSHWRIDYVRQA
ncbi:hypothetical protein KC19_VG274600 [Ceratodon purpureus]|uniref:Uncharacterized protein n=1 Tax=Ceratodon purpureus TaxID=3225 RepID=A0A8T0HV47_CERPU|nr:hypothetical protein KC19_VG274600 [Ceratodon purpureus]